eukprot:m.123852 g.123852  ORF g.123852 m.123852 type:complete len:457 (+) comp16267_c0_seq2:51-1421(+)
MHAQREWRSRLKKSRVFLHANQRRRNSKTDWKVITYARKGLEWVGLGSIMEDLSGNRSFPLDRSTPHVMSMLSTIASDKQHVYSVMEDFGPFTYSSLAMAVPQTIFGDGLECSANESCPDGTARNPQQPHLCTLLPRADIVLDYLYRGGFSRRWETAAKLRARLGFFSKSLTHETARSYLQHSVKLDSLEDNARRILNTTHLNNWQLRIDVLQAGVEIPVSTRTPNFHMQYSEDVPEWLKVVMHHSQLFEEYRIRNVRAQWVLSPDVMPGSACVCNQTTYLNGPRALPTITWRANLATLYDADSIFQAVQCSVPFKEDKVGTYPEGSLLSYSTAAEKWKATFADQPLRLRSSVILRFVWEVSAADDPVYRRAPLTLDNVLKKLEDDLRSRQRLNFKEHLLRRDVPALRHKFALLLMSEYINYPSLGATDFSLCTRTRMFGDSFEAFLNAFFDCEDL